jgi:MFS family permease
MMLGETVQSLGGGLFHPYFAIYLTGPVGLTGTQTGVILLAGAITSMIVSPWGGLVSDRIGRRPVMLTALAGSSVCVFALSLAEGWPAVLAINLVWSFCTGMFQPAASAYVADVVEPELRNEAYGLWRIANNGAMAVGPPLGALIVWALSLRAVFVAAGLLIAVYLAIGARSLPESHHAASEERPPRLRDALRDARLLVLAFATMIVAYLFAQFEDVLGVFLVRERGLEIATWGLLFGINPLLVTVFQYPIARLAAPRPRLALVVGSLLYGLPMFALVWLESVPALVLVIVALTIGEMIHAPTSTTFAVDIAPERLRGSYQGVVNLSWSASSGLAMLIGLALIGHGHGEAMLAAALPLAIVAALAYAAIPSRRDARPAAVATLEA